MFNMVGSFVIILVSSVTVISDLAVAVVCVDVGVVVDESDNEEDETVVGFRKLPKRE